MNDDERTLCNKCVDNYRTAGYEVKRKDYNQKKECCDICNWREAYSYLVKRLV